MDPHLARVLQALQETTAASTPPPASQLNLPVQLQAVLAQQQSQPQSQSYDPRRIYQPDIPIPSQQQQQKQQTPSAQSFFQPAAPPPAPAAAPAAPPASERVDPRMITKWPAALKYITTVITTNPATMERLKKMKLHQRDHERQWWRSREALLERHSKNADNRMAMDSLLKSFGVSATSLELTEEEKLQELQTYDEKVYRASVQMYSSMAQDFKSLGIPFFVITEEEFPGDRSTFVETRQKVIDLIDDLT
ncbi:hypothetical protein TWF730_010669 [Orbilia blumenaviensis]|uniref:Uncharacterized protein n=1 Tax=Orbilia blumenaviensis TaxID=1796055 RepID=A0AAV9UNX8_9PEZI